MITPDDQKEVEKRIRQYKLVMRKKVIVISLAFSICLLPPLISILLAQEPIRSVHVFVALCDNANQGIVPVPERFGNGDDPKNNLFWGALYGVKTFFRNADNWKLINSTIKLSENVLERCVFKHKMYPVFLVADAYRGSKIKQTISDFFVAAAGGNPNTLKVGQSEIPIYGRADLIVYVGHDGLMDFSVEPTSKKNNTKKAVVLACKSKQYFQPHLSKLGAKSLLLTTGLMAPEAYILKAVVDGWISGDTGEQIRLKAATAYNKYQKCGLNRAKRLFYSDEGQE